MLRMRIRHSADFIEPCLPSPAKKPPSGRGWIHEVKHAFVFWRGAMAGVGIRDVRPTLLVNF
jgi:hypothetical protein